MTENQFSPDCTDICRRDMLVIDDDNFALLGLQNLLE